jgi:para-nitrobenzyl esterase
MFNDSTGNTRITRRALLRGALLGGGAALLGGWAKPELSFATDSASPVAETVYGKVRGVTIQGVRIYRGIPYGGPTQGARRFMPPSRPEQWAGVFEATHNGPRSPQGGGTNSIFTDARLGAYFSGGRTDAATLAAQTESENCLVLNVLTPGHRGRLPVMVYIHGGGFTQGSGVLTAFSDRFVREHNVVLVGVNHRLGALGYTYLGAISEKYADSGNVGQLDLIAALEWVRDNIANFGGDPEKVTIFGESGGGAKISTLLAMPAAKGLFKRAIIESGSMLRVSDKESAAKLGKNLLDNCGLSEAQVDELQKIPLEKLMAFSPAHGPGGIMRVGPVLDGRSILQQTWDPTAPEVSADVAMIIGNCQDEATLFSLFSADQTVFNLDEAGLRDHVVKAGIPESDAGRIIALYHRDHPSETPSDIYFRMASDRGARQNAVAQAERRIAQGKANVYLYHFEWNTPLLDGKLRAFHTAELPLAMRLVEFPESEVLSKQIAGAWASFARDGNPHHPGLPKWPAYSITERATMLFNAPVSEAVNDPDREERLALQKYPSGNLL